MMTSILNMIIDGTISHLQSELMASVGDETAVGLIKSGKLQDDPTVNITNIMMRGGDKNWPHVLNVNPQGFQAPTREIGGGVFNVRRFTLQLEFFFDGESERDPPRQKANVILSRLEYSLYGMEMPQGVDDFGEHAILLQVPESYLEEGGGEGTFIWRGHARIEVLTGKR